MKWRTQGRRNAFMYRRSLIRSAAAAGLLPGAARAQSFPSKQLRLLVGAAAGGGADIVARIPGHEMTRSGRPSIMVHNKPRPRRPLAPPRLPPAPAPPPPLSAAPAAA